MRVESEPVQIEAENEEEGGDGNPFDFVRDYNYRYKVERDLDGSGANDWKKGAAVANTGRKRSGFLDLYAERSRRAKTSRSCPTAEIIRKQFMIQKAARKISFTRSALGMSLHRLLAVRGRHLRALGYWQQIL